MPMWLSDIFRAILSLLDKVVYWVMTLLISLFDQLATVRVFDTKVIEGFATRIYFLISVVMIFKVSFSIIQYIINPDSISDNSKGMGKLIQGVLIVLVSLVGVRYIFNFAYDLQDAVINTRVIEKLILGSDANSGASELDAEQQAEIKSQIPYSLLSAFIKPNYEKISGLDYENGTYVCFDHDDSYGTTKYSMYKQDYDEETEEQFFTTEFNEDFFKCLDKFSDEKDRKFIISGDITVKGKSGTIYYASYQNNSYELLLELVNDESKTEDDTYLFEYKFLISTVAGVFVVIIYLNFCIDLAIRSVKFGFLQLIAPIPIISMIDPKSASGGMMSKWIKNCTNTYLGLFIRIAAVNFVVYIVNIIFTTNITGNSGAEVGTFVKIVVLFGALMFAKDLPKLITELTGIDMSGNFKMNPLKRVPGAEKALQTVGKVGSAALTGAVGFAGGAFAAGMARGMNGDNVSVGKIVGSTLSGGLNGAFKGMKAGYGSCLKDGFGKVMENTKGIADKHAKYGDSTLGDRMKAKLPAGFAPADKDNKTIDMMKESADAASNLDSYLEKEVLKNKGDAYQDLALAKHAKDMIGDVSRDNYYRETKDHRGTVISREFDEAAYAAAVQQQSKLRKAAEERYREELEKAKAQHYSSNRSSNDTIRAYMNTINRDQQKLAQNKDLRGEAAMTGYNDTDYDSIDKYKKFLEERSGFMKSTDEYKRHQDAKNSVGK